MRLMINIEINIQNMQESLQKLYKIQQYQCRNRQKIKKIYKRGNPNGQEKYATAWREPESIILSEISQAVRDKYHMI